jgi:predicted nucleic acid-binding protein
MNGDCLVVDSSIAVKWLVAEQGSLDAIVLRDRGRLSAPELLMAECTNALWKKVLRREITTQVAMLAVRVLERMEVELVSMRSLATASAAIAMKLGHPAYDCFYLALAIERQCQVVTADQRLIAITRQSGDLDIASRVVTLSELA